nr:pirin family protein [Bacillota bacterium]
PVVSGLGHDGTLRIHQAAAFYVSRLEAGQTVTHTLADGRRAFLYVIDGGIDLNGVAMGTGDQARIEAEEALSVAAREDTELILIDLP